MGPPQGALFNKRNPERLSPIQPAEQAILGPNYYSDICAIDPLSRAFERVSIQSCESVKSAESVGFHSVSWPAAAKSHIQGLNCSGPNARAQVLERLRPRGVAQGHDILDARAKEEVRGPDGRSGLVTGETQFKFHVAEMSFKSTSYQWLVIAGARAQYKGEGTINGSGLYGFLLTAIDGQRSGGGGEDRFRVKIWDDSTGQIVYDNQLEADDNSNASTVISGGSIVIHR